MKIVQKNCVFDCECPFFSVGTNGYFVCRHPAFGQSKAMTTIGLLFEKCPLKGDPLIIKLKK